MGIGLRNFNVINDFHGGDMDALAGKVISLISDVTSNVHICKVYSDKIVMLTNLITNLEVLYASNGVHKKASNFMGNYMAIKVVPSLNEIIQTNIVMMQMGLLSTKPNATQEEVAEENKMLEELIVNIKILANSITVKSPIAAQ